MLIFFLGGGGGGGGGRKGGSFSFLSPLIAYKLLPPYPTSVYAEFSLTAHLPFLGLGLDPIF